jgi:hypothetical protein
VVRVLIAWYRKRKGPGKFKECLPIWLVICQLRIFSLPLGSGFIIATTWRHCLWKFPGDWRITLMIAFEFRRLLYLDSGGEWLDGALPTSSPLPPSQVGSSGTS